MLDKKDITHANQSNYAKIRAMETNQFKGGELFRVSPYKGTFITIYDDETNQNVEIPLTDERIKNRPVISGLDRRDKCMNYMMARETNPNKPRSAFQEECDDPRFFSKTIMKGRINAHLARKGDPYRLV
jgi:hypothetical protein